MNNWKKLRDLLDAANAYNADCMDYFAQTKKMDFNDELKLSFPVEANLFQGEASLAYTGLNDWAKSQLSGRLDTPAPGWLFSDKHCPPTLAKKILNELTQVRPDAKMMVRTKSDHVRAFLSDSYTVFDHKDLLDLVCQAVDTMGGVDPLVKRVEVGDELSAYVIFPEVTFAHDPRDNGKGGELHPALHIRNSERGGGTAKITSAVFSGYCQNGMIYGYKANEVLSIRHRYISTAVMGSLVAQSIATGLEMSEEAAKAFVQSQEIHIPPVNLSRITERWATNYGLSVSEREDWLKAITGESNRNERPDDVRLFDVLNAATWIAQQKEPVLAVQYESMAGDMLRSYHRSEAPDTN